MISQYFNEPELYSLFLTVCGAGLLLVVTAVAAFSLIQSVQADRIVQGGPTIESVPDSGWTICLLGFALLGFGALQRKLSS
jgi:hypothetical protein